MLTRKEYLNAARASADDTLAVHREYYGQFVTEDIKYAVEVTFGLDTLVNAYAKDPHFNSIPLSHWDSLVISQKKLVDEDLLEKAGETQSLLSRTCIFKEGARQIVEFLYN